MVERSVYRTMNTDTFEALQAAGFDIKQATVLATAIPDIEPPLDRLRAEMNAKFADLRANMERRLNMQTWTIVGTLVALGALLAATNLWG